MRLTNLAMIAALSVGLSVPALAGQDYDSAKSRETIGADVTLAGATDDARRAYWTRRAYWKRLPAVKGNYAKFKCAEAMDEGGPFSSRNASDMYHWCKLDTLPYPSWSDRGWPVPGSR